MNTHEHKRLGLCCHCLQHHHDLVATVVWSLACRSSNISRVGVRAQQMRARCACNTYFLMISVNRQLVAFM